MTSIDLVFRALAIAVIVTISSPILAHGATTSPVVVDRLIVTAAINADGTTDLRLEAALTNVGTDAVSSLDFRVDSLQLVVSSASVNGSPVDTSLTTLERHTIIQLGLASPLEPGQHLLVRLDMTAHDLQSEASLSADGIMEERSFIFYVRPAMPVTNFTFNAVLPPHASLSSTSAAPLFPTATGNMTDGESLIFYWNLGAIDVGQEQVFVVKYEIPISQSATTVGIRSWLVGGVLFFGGAGVAVLAPRVLRAVRRLRHVRYVGITREEQELLSVIERKGGSCPQKVLSIELDMSQAKVSMLLKNLEERGLVRRFRDGRENMVHLMGE
ncbi:MAG: helix-turn-helix transcriptional regulator [Candidatus Thorarchaeota archaeon]